MEFHSRPRVKPQPKHMQSYEGLLHDVKKILISQLSHRSGDRESQNNANNCTWLQGIKGKINPLSQPQSYSAPC